MSPDSHFVDQVRNATDAADVIRQYVELKKSGSRLKGLCPFHHEKTPSFFVDESLGLYKCFGCGKGGDIFSFIMEMESLSFPEALELLARRAGIPIPDRRPGPDGVQSSEIEDVLKEAVSFYHRCLLSDVPRVKAYLEKRGFMPAAWKEWGLGWAPGGDKLALHLQKKYSRKLLLASGTVSEGRGSDYDFFRKRLVIPLHSPSGRLVGMSGRVIDDSEPKYINSRESSFFQKKRLLYNYNRARKEARNASEWIVVEGYFDVIRMTEHGFMNVVATMGTAMTEEHGQLLKKTAPRVLLCFDGDESGLAAAEKAIRVLLKGGLDVDVLFLPAGMDPDDYLVNHGKDSLREMIQTGRLSFFDFLFRREFKEGIKGLQPLEKSQRIHKLVEVINLIPDSFLRHEFLEKIARLAGVPLQLLKKEVPLTKPAVKRFARENSLPDMERSFLACILHHPELQIRYRERLLESIFTEISLVYLVRELMSLLGSSEGVDIYQFRTHLIDKGGDITALSDLAFMDVNPLFAEKYILHLEERYFREELKRIQISLESADENRMKELLAEKINISARLLEARRKRGDLKS